MADELQEAFGVKAKLVAGRGGVFDVDVDGKRIFSKKELGRFPEDGEVAGLLKKNS